MAPKRMGVEWSLLCASCREFAWLGSMKPWKWNGFQIDTSSVLELLSLHALAERAGSDRCELFIDVDSSRVETFSLEPADGWREDLRSRTFWTSISVSTEPPRALCAECSRWLAVLTRGGEPVRQKGAQDAIVIGSALWLCDDRCLRAFASRPGRVFRAAPRRGALTLGCRSCASEIIADGADSLALAEWFTDHLAPGCALTVRAGR
jgi:hypothetical protein